MGDGESRQNGFWIEASCLGRPPSWDEMSRMSIFFGISEPLPLPPNAFGATKSHSTLTKLVPHSRLAIPVE